MKKIIRKTVKKAYSFYIHRKYKNIASSSFIFPGNRIGVPDHLVMGENSTLNTASAILNMHANFIMGKNSGAARELLVVTGNHMSIVGLNLKQVTDEVKLQYDINKEMDRDVVVDDDVWIGSRVTLLSGVHIGRGCEIGAGSIVRKSTPPYSIVVGNPAKIIGFRFTPEEIIEHEKVQYNEQDRIPIDILEKNYNKYYVNRIKEIKSLLKY